MLKTLACITILGLLALGCGGGGGGDGPACAPATQDLTGTWAVDETSTSPGCGVEQTSYSLVAQQVGSDITVTDSRGREYTGFMCGDRVEAHAPFTYQEDGGTTTVHDLVFTVVGDFLSGTSRWSWSDSFESCTGTSTFSATR